MEKQAIDVSDVQFSRDHFTLGPIDLQIPKGYITAIVGPNGSGKSTLFQMLMNQIKPQSGTITVLDQNIDEHNDEQLKQRIGYLTEEPTIFDGALKARVKSRFHAKWYTNWNETTYENLLRNLDTRDDISFKKMSKGMRRKFDFTLALAHQPDLLILDEPSSGLDPIAWKTMIEALHQYMESGERTVLMATHIIDEVKRLADFIVFMANGKILGMYEKDELLQGWATFFIQSNDVNLESLKKVSGYREIKQMSSGHYELLSDQAIETEKWLKLQHIEILNKQLLELDEILFEHMKRVGYFTKKEKVRV